MVIEDFGPEFIYVPGPKNVVAEAMSLLDNTNDPDNTKINCYFSIENHLLELANLFASDHIPDDIYPLNFKLIQKEQVRDTSLVTYAKKNSANPIHVFHGVGYSH